MNQTENTRFNTTQAAEILGLRPATLAIWRSTGRSQLKYKKIGRLIYYFKNDLDEFLESCTKTHTGE